MTARTPEQRQQPQRPSSTHRRSRRTATTSVSYNNNTGVDITLVATDADGDPLTYSLVGPNGGATAGIVTLAGDVAHYTPTIGRVGVDTFQWTASDGTLTSSPATETINLTDSPPVVVNTSFDVTENTPLTIAAPGLLNGASSTGNAPLTVTKVSMPSEGTVTYQPDGSFTYTPDRGFHRLRQLYFRRQRRSDR